MGMLEVSIATFGLTLLALLAWVVGVDRELGERRRACDEAWSQLEELLRRRDEALGPFLALCEAELADLGTVVRSLAEARACQASAAATDERAQRSAEVSAALRGVLEAALRRVTLPEGFPELKARLEAIEEQLADRGEHYNAVALRWNALLGRPPASLIARLSKARRRESWTTLTG
ncbi:MAG: LemA family protein [Myxococcales bacterium]